MNANEFKVRKRNPKACRRCHRRKQRCVGYPTCLNCEAANSTCTRSETSAFQPASERYHGLSKDALFHRIEELEAQLNNVTKNSNCRNETSLQYESPEQLPPNLPEVGHLFDVMEFLTVGQMSEATHQTTVSAPRTLIAREMDQLFENTVLENYDWDKAASVGNKENDAEFCDDRLTRPAVPSDGEGLKYIRVYMETMHNHMPYIDSEEIYQLHEKRLEPIAPTRSARWKSFKIFMVYTIGAATCRAMESQPGIPVADLLRTALQHKPAVTELRSLQSIEAMMLLIMYNLRIPNSSNIWYMIGLAMRTAIDLGLHREINYLHLKPDESQRRRRLFWSVYVMDRSIARLLDRPFNIAEYDIDVGLPFDYQEPFQGYSHEAPMRRERHLRTSIAVFIPAIRLIRLKSQIQTRVHRVDKDVSLLLPEINPLFSALEEYKRSLQSDLSPMDKDWINMHWNNGIMILIQPFLSELPSDHELIQTCACSSFLFAVAERNKKLEKYRDTWEAVLTKVMEHLDRVSCSQDLSRSITRQASPSSLRSASLTAGRDAESCLSSADIPFLDNIHSVLSRGLHPQGPWNPLQTGWNATDLACADDCEPSLEDLADIYPTLQASTRNLASLDKDEIWDSMIPGNLFEESRAELRMFDDFFTNAQ
ncbi:hypothetical protein N7493_007432 [Penicillium malachiteum]|uniref:Zn(2)-C6 fungal-type domain-containing protein n=1 Tax=Penicillium malachiteum TaxID=1324776 RepID=A0AAD6MU15_9EURO|nr:hypothetical protein N7493_007432 [Penicillium malachiteum]